MYLQELTLSNYRNITRAELAIGRGITVFVGPNGQGKTNLLESVVFAATLQSHRVSSDVALVRSGAASANILSTFRTGERRSVVDVTINTEGSNRVVLNGNPVKRRSIVGQFPIVLFSPQDLALVTGDPSERRQFLDELATQLRPAFVDPLTNYERILRQRNSLLKSARARAASVSSLNTLDDWDEQLAHFGAIIMHRRAELVDALRGHVREAYEDIAGTGEGVDVTITNTVDLGPDHAVTAETFRSALQTQRSHEIERGMTLVGPHRDELVLSLAGLVAKSHASHGESWSFALALRLSAARLIRQVSRVGDPIVMLDDVFAELDRPRRARLGGIVAEYEQVIITAAVEEELPDLVDVRRIQVKNGVIGGGLDE